MAKPIITAIITINGASSVFPLIINDGLYKIGGAGGMIGGIGIGIGIPQI